MFFLLYVVGFKCDLSPIHMTTVFLDAEVYPLCFAKVLSSNNNVVNTIPCAQELELLKNIIGLIHALQNKTLLLISGIRTYYLKKKDPHCKEKLVLFHKHQNSFTKCTFMFSFSDTKENKKKVISHLGSDALILMGTPEPCLILPV